MTQTAIEDVVLASRVLYLKGLVDAFGHASRRCPLREGVFYMSRSKAPGLVQQEDVIALDFDGAPIDRPGERVFLERFIHGEIYRAHPGVQAIVHSHAPAVLPFSVSKQTPVRPLSHMCGFLDGVCAPFEIADHAGDCSNLLISNAQLGKALADHLGGSAIVLMRGHGFTAVGASMAEAVFRAVYTKFNCEIQQAALQLGEPRYLTSGEAHACEQATLTQLDRAWSLWVKEAQDDAAHNLPLAQS